VRGGDVRGEQTGAGAEVEHAPDLAPGEAECRDRGSVEGVVVGHDAPALGFVAGRSDVKVLHRVVCHDVQIYIIA
jgi:hypothetical protein